VNNEGLKNLYSSPNIIRASGETLIHAKITIMWKTTISAYLGFSQQNRFRILDSNRGTSVFEANTTEERSKALFSVSKYNYSNSH
jgi:hypothetical protein